MWVNGATTVERGEELRLGEMGRAMKVSGWQTVRVVTGSSASRTAVTTRVSSTAMKFTAMEDTAGKGAGLTRESGSTTG
jgi:hypothetical protein